MNKKIILDTNVLIIGVDESLLSDAEIFIPRVVIDELKYMYDSNRIELAEKGFSNINFLIKKYGAKIIGNSEGKISSEIADNIIVETAKTYEAKLLTYDRGMFHLAVALGVEVEKLTYLADISIINKLFTNNTMSVHIKDKIYKKVGTPGDWVLEIVDEKIDLNKLILDIDMIVREKGVLYEFYNKNLKIVQLDDYRIVITTPPLSDQVEMTIVKSIKKLNIKDYSTDDRIIIKLEKANGVIIAGAPGSGKSTFAAALANFYLSNKKIVKTIEQPRDMKVEIPITQYSKNAQDLDRLKDVLLLVRPDYVIFDEIRNNSDFEFYGDLRLAGVGMVGIVHANSPIDAIHRFIGRFELGLLPHIIDTVIFIEKGNIKNIYELTLTMKLPTGMKETELTRPVIEVKDYKTGMLLYEIYKFGEEIILMPINNTILNRILRKYRTQIINGKTYLILSKREYRQIKKYIDIIRNAGIEIINDRA